MGFQIKDLNISVQEDGFHQPRQCECFGVSYQITYRILNEVAINELEAVAAPVRIPPGCGMSYDPGPEDTISNFEAVKAQLREALVNVEALEAAGVVHRTPQTVEEVDMLTGKLNEALEELRIRRATLDA